MAKLKLKNMWSRTTSGLGLGLSLLFLMLWHKGFTLIIILLFATVAFLEVIFIDKTKKSIVYTIIALIAFLWAISSGMYNFVLLKTIPSGVWTTFKVIEPKKLIVFILTLCTISVFNYKISYKTVSTHTVALTLLVIAARSSIWILFKSTSYGYGFEMLLLVFVIIFCYDVGAYFTGASFGKSKISPISPKKTWEGFFGGVILAYVWAVIWKNIFFVPFLNNDIAATHSFIWIITLVLCLSSLIGDLYFSLLKRTYGLDDFSNTIPGHGGVLDRLDSIVYANIVFYFIMINAL